jgi:hypothetical protein
MSMDAVGPFHQNDQGNRYLMIVIDFFTKWSEAYAVLNHEALRWQKP